MKRTFSLSLLLSAFCLSTAAHAVDVTGAGSSFVFPVLSKWSQGFSEKTGNRINYQSIGSGGGIAQIKAGTVDFGATDAPMSTDDLQKGGLGQFPTIIGGIVPVINVEGIEPGKLKLDGPTMAKIFMGEIKTWNDPAIAALNPGMKLPEGAITVVRRSDGSGTSYNFTNYLAKVSPEWKEKFNFGTTVNWPVGVGGKGNEGIAAYVKQIKGSIGYVEYAYALTNKMTHVQLKNAAGNFVQPEAKSFQAAAATADWKSAKDFNLLMTNAPGADAWPITATTWIVMYKEPKNEERSKVAFDFFKWSLEHGQKDAAALDYVPVPDTLVKQIEGYWASDFKK
ncbi:MULTISPECIES: phosphate ABC transporter substrate-binding protein PstS [Pseudomonas]|jgi:phosphate transport system substrate-binding protein|uniref:Phosphate-binding protein PstS n=1 Tax=Pseudomonas flavocrustae TaxID=2991719 RepID=A0ABT6IHH4_9PSED|nr:MULTISPECIES: phosphate ABC transporter substrate-binding protein PstS [Pseudomonas]EHK70692.1 phosphate ABC transporter periplasmic phosphate-binding protein [Pseudomonas psychrotolerans L19]KTT55390.1 phosphate ABC transporter substrate-binding protein [Pseudomonas psychrotolerans]MBA1182183.1 phosphate ABC transporter substrate-binding protein PstS [Pseudomonas psychrotolerans]MBA1212636.1 phosphate ABC transporter substrate-binding protein PstS [Pseudomonas psychrotolerans]MCI1008666.1 